MPRTAAQNEAIRDRRKDKIIQRSVGLFATKGFDEITIDDISKVSHCAHGLFYHYFDAKEDLYNAIITFFETKYSTLSIHCDDLEQGKGIEGIQKLLQQYLALLKSSDTIVYYSRLALIKERKAKTAEKPLLGDDLEKEILLLIKKGQADGSIRRGDPEDMTRLVLDVLVAETERRLDLGITGYRPYDSLFLLSLYMAETTNQ